MVSFILFLCCVGLGYLVYFLFKKNQDNKVEKGQLEQRLNYTQQKLDPYLKASNALDHLKQLYESVERNIELLKNEASHHEKQLDNIKIELRSHQDEMDLVDMGFYNPQFNFATSDEFKFKISDVREKQKRMMKDKTAITCAANWQIGGSEKEGQKFMDRIVKLTGRAFNNECEASISNVSWSNIQRMNERISKTFNDLNKLNEVNQVVISQVYKKLKLDELHLVFEQKMKQKEERDRAAESARQLREEEKLENERRKAEDEEDKYQRLLDRAQREANQAALFASQQQDIQSQERINRLNKEVSDLAEKLAEAHAKSERAKSMAQQTKAGHVYIISNIGSFGENIYKIGMTRRLDPYDRIDELSSASVPFFFDAHAVIYCEDAPALENELHRKFADKRVNMVNNRKEFFRVTLDEIKQEVKHKFPQAEFSTFPEAEEYRKTMALRNNTTYVAVETPRSLQSPILHQHTVEQPNTNRVPVSGALVFGEKNDPSPSALNFD